MARIDFLKDQQGKTALLGKNAFGVNQNNPLLDLTYGGQFGWAPNLTEWVSNQGYVQQNLVCMLLEAPRFFSLMPNPEKWVECLRALVEVHAKSIDGFNRGLTVEVEEHAVGGAGEMQQEVTDVKRERSVPKFSFTEKYGRPIQTFLENWIEYGLMDPDTKYALIGTLAKNQVPDDMLADWFSGSILVFEPDPTHRKVVKSWITTNFYPLSTGEIVGKRDLTTAKELITLDIEFSGISQSGLGTDIVAQRILDTINLENANPYLRPGFIQDISADVDKDTTGYKKGVNDLSASAVHV